MSIRVECDQCFETYNVPDEREGQQFKCRSCGNRLTVQATVDADYTSSRRSGGSKKASRKKKKKSGGNSVPLIAGGIALVFLAVGVFLISQMLTKQNAPAELQRDNESPAIVEGSETSATPEAPVAATPSPSPATPPTSSGGSSTNLTARPTAPPVNEKVTWSVQADPTATPVSWPEKPRWKLNYDGEQGGLLFPATPSPFGVVGITAGNIDKAVIVDLTSGKEAGQFTTKAAGHNERALSPDGRYLALSILKPRGLIEIWTPESQQASNAVQVTQNDDIVSKIDFRSPTELVVIGHTKVGTRVARQIKVVNVETGEQVSHLVTEKDFDFKRNCLSPGGRYFVSLTGGNVVTVFDLQSGTCVGELEQPKSSPSGNSLSPHSIAFTPDGGQICTLQTGQWETRLGFLDTASGEPVDEIILAGRLKHISSNDVLYEGQKIQFIKDGEFILLNGQLLVHRDTKRIVWLLDILPTEDQYQLTNNAERRVAGDHLLIAGGPRNSPVLGAAPIPFDKIEAALEVVEAKGVSTLSPPEGQVAIDVDISTIRFGDPEKTKADLASTLNDRIAFEGLAVTENAPAVLHLQYAEGEGNTLSLSSFSPGLPRNQQAPGTGGSVESTRALMQLSLKIEKAEVWSKVIALDPRVLFFKGDATNEAARNQVFEEVQQALYGIPLVWYVSEKKPYATLPIVDFLQTQSFSATGVRPTRRPGSR